MLLMVACSPARQDSSSAATATQSDTSTAQQAPPDATNTAEQADQIQPQYSSSTAAKAKGKTKEKSMSDYKDKVAEIHTTAGEIDIRFFPDVAPNHVKN